MDPESAKRLASGVWKHEHRPDTGEDVWTCDVYRLREKLHHMACSDRRMYEQYCRNPDVFLDARFGDMTAKAFRHYSQGDRIRFRTNPYDDYAMLGRMNAKYDYKMYDQYSPPRPQKKEETVKFERKLVRTLPFHFSSINGEIGLLANLQSEFDWWAGEQVKRLRSWVA